MDNRFWLFGWIVDLTISLGLPPSLLRRRGIFLFKGDCYMSFLNYRVNAYVDGLNLFHSVNRRGCDVKRMIGSRLRNHDQLNQTRYYTSFPSHCDEDIIKSYKKIIQTLTKSGVDIIEGEFREHNMLLYHNKIRPVAFQEDFKEERKYYYKRYEEKKTDVALAVDLVADSYKNSYDKAILVSADSDFIPAVVHVLSSHATKQISIFLPPERGGNEELKKLAWDYQPRLTIESITHGDIEKFLVD